MNIDHVGETNENRYGDKMCIVTYRSSIDIDVQFQDEHQAIVHTTYSSFKKRQVKNPYGKTVLGVGYVGEGKYRTRVNGEHPPVYLIWKSIIQRCYDVKSKDKYPTYYGICTMSDDWLNFQNFATWYEENYYDAPGRIHIDKDILYPGNTVYSPETCLLVPQRINMIFAKRSRVHDADLPNGITRYRNQFKSVYNTKHLGLFDRVEDAYAAYSKAKEKHIKIVANDMKAILPDKVYDALLKYQCPTFQETSHRSNE